MKFLGFGHPGHSVNFIPKNIQQLRWWVATLGNFWPSHQAGGWHLISGVHSSLLQPLPHPCPATGPCCWCAASALVTLPIATWRYLEPRKNSEHLDSFVARVSAGV